MNDQKIALIGFGEVGHVLCQDLKSLGTRRLAAWDTKFGDLNSGPSRAADAENLEKTNGARQAIDGASLIISAVTAGQTIEAARSVAKAIEPDAYYLDLNSASPRTKISAAKIIGECGGRYVEASVMSPIGPKRIESPVFLGGPFAENFLTLAHQLGFTGTELFSAELGAASAAKMCRSVIIKGVEALLTEALLTARRHNVDETVLNSLSDLLPGPDWASLAPYMISRSLIHGARRAEEMTEAAKTVEESGFTPLMSRACAERQIHAANFSHCATHKKLGDLLDAVLEADKEQLL